MVGTSINKFLKIMFGMVALVSVVLFIVVPLLIFSELSPNHQSDKISSAKMEIKLIFNQHGNFTLLKDLYMVSENYNKTDGSQDLKFNKVLENSLPFTPEAIQSISDLLKQS